MAKGEKRSDRARERWARIVDEWRRSGLGVWAFCRKRGVGEHSFYAWRRRLGDGKPARAAARPGFLPVRVVSRGAPAGGIEEVRLDERIDDPSSESIHVLAHVLDVLGGPAHGLRGSTCSVDTVEVCHDPLPVVPMPVLAPVSAVGLKCTTRGRVGMHHLSAGALTKATALPTCPAERKAVSEGRLPSKPRHAVEHR